MTATMGILKMLWAVLSSSVQDGALPWWPCTGHSLHCASSVILPSCLPFLSRGGIAPYKSNSPLIWVGFYAFTFFRRTQSAFSKLHTVASFSVYFLLTPPFASSPQAQEMQISDRRWAQLIYDLGKAPWKKPALFIP